MPNDLVLVRHGEAEGNVVTNMGKTGDNSGYTDAFVTTPGHQWRLTENGCAQAVAIGAWLTEQFPADADQPSFDTCFVSPYVRTRETAGLLGLPGARWLLNRALRERDWGDIGSMPREEFAKQYARSAVVRGIDPLYWVPPGGESLAQVSEDRVRNVLGTLHRECSDQKVLAVTHGELMWCMRLILERWDDDEFVRRDHDSAEKIHNAEALHYTRTNPHTGAGHDRLSFLRKAHPVRRDGTWAIDVTSWIELAKPRLDNEDLLATIADVPSLLNS